MRTKLDLVERDGLDAGRKVDQCLVEVVGAAVDDEMALTVPVADDEDRSFGFACRLWDVLVGARSGRSLPAWNCGWWTRGPGESELAGLRGRSWVRQRRRAGAISVCEHGPLHPRLPGFASDARAWPWQRPVGGECSRPGASQSNLRCQMRARRGYYPIASGPLGNRF